LKKRDLEVPWIAILAGLLAEGGLVFGLWLRVLFFRSFPDPFPNPDTWSYLTGAFGLLQKGQFDLFSLRTPGFPILVWIALAIFKSFAALNVIHGALTLLSALAIGYVVRAFGGAWHLPAALAASFVVVHPQVLYWEHFVMTEGSFHAVFALALCAAALAIVRPTLGRAAVAGVLTALMILIRPQGLFLMPLLLLALAWSGRRLGRRKLLWMLAAAVAGPLFLLGGWSARNARVHGFFGLSNIGPLQLFGVSARWIELERPAYANDKVLIADSIRRYRSMSDDIGYVQYAPDGPAVILARSYGNDERGRDAVYYGLAYEAILHHPFAFMGRGFATSYKTVTGNARLGRDFDTNALWDRNWIDLDKHFPVNEYRATVAGTRFPTTERASTFNEYVGPFLGWSTSFIRVSLGATLLALLALPLLNGPRRLATALAALSVILLILTAGFLSDASERYLSVIHGSAALAGALAITGLLERWRRARG